MSRISILVLLWAHAANPLSLPLGMTRRSVLGKGNTVSLVGLVWGNGVLLQPDDVHAAESLRDRMAKRDPKALTKPLFSAQPALQVLPSWFSGSWDTTVKFNGFEFPPIEGLSKETLVKDVGLAGFQKLSIAMLVDVGKPSTTYETRFGPAPVVGVFPAKPGAVEDRAFNLRSSVEATLALPGCVTRVDYDSRANPNRCSIVFAQGATRNAERIELFVNNRESELLDEHTFLASELFRQVTFSASQTAGVPREAISEYQYFWTHRCSDNGTLIRSNLLTAAYFEPQDPNFFKAVSVPAAVYSHTFEFRRRTPLEAAPLV